MNMVPVVIIYYKFETYNLQKCHCVVLSLNALILPVTGLWQHSGSNTDPVMSSCDKELSHKYSEIKTIIAVHMKM